MEADWHQRHVVRVFSTRYGCPVYGAFVAAVAAMVSVFVEVGIILENDMIRYMIYLQKNVIYDMR